MSRVSVIILTRNRARYLRRAIESVLNQSFKDVEIIVIDDASADETAQVVRSFREPKLRYVRHETQRGEAAGRNDGIRHATGEYVAFLDDDDVWLPRKLESQVQLMDSCSAQVGGVYTGFLNVELDSQAVLGKVIPEKRGHIFHELCRQNWIGVSTLLLRRSCFDKAGLFDERLPFGVDHDMWIRISQFYGFECIQEPLALYSLHPSQMSADYSLLLRGKEHQLTKYADYFARDKKSYSHHLLRLGILHCYDRNTAKARQVFLRAIRARPLEVRAYFNWCLSLLGAERFIKVKAFKERLQRAF